MNDDILASTACSKACTTNCTPGIYNLTQTISILYTFLISGSPGCKIMTQNNLFSSGQCGSAFRAAFCIKSQSFTAQGFLIDDAMRQFVGGISGDVFLLDPTSSNVLIQSMTVFNASSNAISAQGTNAVITTSTLTGPITQKVGGNYGVLMGSTASHIRVFLNTISGFNGSDVSGIQTSNGASFIDITANDLFQNSFGISSTWGKFVTIEANKIHNNFAGGILLTTGGFGTIAAGPISISGGQITDNAQEPNNDAQCNNLHCPGIMIKGARPSWDGVAITGVNIKDTQAVHTQLYDISIISTNYSNLTITGNSLGVTSSGITINLGVSPLPTWIISDNSGFNPQPIRGPLTAGATPFTYTNNDGYREQIELITIGDMTAFTCRGIANIIQVDAISPILNTRDTCVFTYVAVAPTYDVLPT